MIAAALDDADRDKIATMPRLRRLSSYTTFNPTAFIYGQDPPDRSAKSCLVRIRPDLDPSSPLKTTPLDGDFTSSQVTKSRASTYGDDRKRARSIMLQSPPHAPEPTAFPIFPPRRRRVGVRHCRGGHSRRPTRDEYGRKAAVPRSREIKGEFWQGRWGVAAKKPSGHVQEYLEDRDFARQDQKFAGADLAEIGYR
ncbi:hypothetical protein MY4824_009849 [Beauveria thailandica]